MRSLLPDVRLRIPALHLVLGVFMLGYILLGLATLSNGHSWGDDWAQYVLHARNIATGHPYADTGYLFNPDVPTVGPPTYPPGLALLLAPIVAVFGINIVAFKVGCFLCVVLAVAVAFRLFSFSVGQVTALLAALLFALHPAIWASRQIIGSEAPYLLFSMLVLWWGARPQQNEGKFLSSTAAGILLGFLLYGSVASRSIGIALLPALLVYGWAQRKPLGWFIGFVVCFTLLVWLQTHWLVKPASYENQLKGPTNWVILANANGYWLALADLFPLPFGLSRLSSLVVIFLSALGAWSVCAHREPTIQSARGVRSLAARIPLILWYLAAYVLALHLATIGPSSRLLLPILPIVIALALAGAHLIATHLPHRQRYILPAALVLTVYYAALFVRNTPNDEAATCEACMEMFVYVRTQTAPDTVIVFAKPRAMALLGGRASWRPAQRYTSDELTHKLGKMGANVVVVGTPGSNFAEKYPAVPSVTERIRDSGAEILFRNSMFEVVRIAPIRGAQ